MTPNCASTVNFSYVKKNYIFCQNISVLIIRVLCITSFTAKQEKKKMRLLTTRLNKYDIAGCLWVTV